MTLPQHGRRRAATPTRYRRSAPKASAPKTSAPEVAAAPAPASPADQRPAPRATNRRRSGRAIRPAFSLLAMTFVGGMMVATSVPALAVSATDTEARASVYAPLEGALPHGSQTLDVGSDVVVAPVASEAWDVEAAPPPIPASAAGIGAVALIDTGAIVWPVVDPSRTSDVFGPRGSGCSGCSAYHDGIDFLPGAGTPIMSIADGVVVTATSNGGGLGNYVEVQHNIRGELITSLYAHMESGSIEVSAGQQVTAGQRLGAVGSTGQSTGPHLHLEMYGSDGVRFDGMAWLSANVTG